MLRSSDRLFTFAIIGDTHVKPETGDQSAPWKVNDKATRRARFVSREIARYSPQFVIHLGDLVHPVPELPTFNDAVALTHDIFRPHHNRMHVLPGNHDIGDKPNPTMPAKGVRDSWIDIHERNFGPSWRSFDHEGVRFILLNNPVFNSGSPIEAAQRQWLEKTLSSAAGQRLLVFMHYPLFLLNASEPPTYDNIDEPVRSDILALLARHNVEAVFAGHVHNIFYHRIGGTEFYVMPATSFVRQDFSEMFRVEAVHENGRDDAEKLGFAIVDVYRDGHAVHYLRTYGTELDSAEDRSAVAPRQTTLLPHPKKPGGAPIGVFMRHPWAETVTLPHNGPMDEFARKQARNDYPIAALWRLGVRHLRVPLGDLLDAETRSRMADLVAIGHRFTVMGFGVPAGDVADAIIEHRDLFDRYECVLPYDMILDQAAALQHFRDKLGRPLVLARVATSADDVKVGSKIELFVSHGFRPDQTAEIATLLAGGVNAADGFVVRAGLGTDLPALSAKLDEWSRKSGRDIDLHLRVAANNPANNITDDAAILAATVELFVCALAYPHLTMLVDPFMDIDRGYFVRHGLVDRRCNLRPSGLAVEALAAILGSDAGWTEPPSLSATETEQGRILTLSSGGHGALVLLPHPGKSLVLSEDVLGRLGGSRDTALAVPLDAPWTLSPDIGLRAAGAPLTLPPEVKAPTLIAALPATR